MALAASSPPAWAAPCSNVLGLALAGALHPLLAKERSWGFAAWGQWLHRGGAACLEPTSGLTSRASGWF